MSEVAEFRFFDYNMRRDAEDVRQPANCELVVGGQYMMRVDGSKAVRVLLVTSESLDERNELRAQVVVLEDNPYIKSGTECRPLAFTLEALPR